MIEVYGFLNLERAPFYNKRAETYREWFGIPATVDAYELTARVGAVTAEWLGRNAQAEERLTAWFGKVVESLIRLENLGIGLPKEQQAIIENIQKRRNRIEHHRYDHRSEDDRLIADSLAFILFFLDDVLRESSKTIYRRICCARFNASSTSGMSGYWIAMHRLETWKHATWPTWREEESDTPDEFPGTLDCPICRQDFFVIGYQDKPFCFYCNTSVDGGMCDNCGRTFLTKDGCCSPSDQTLPEPGPDEDVF